MAKFKEIMSIAIVWIMAILVACFMYMKANH